MTYVAHVDRLTAISTRCSIVGKGVRGHCGRGIESGAAASSHRSAATESSTTTAETESTSAAAEASTAEATGTSKATAHATAIAATATKAHTTTALLGITILAHFDHAALPVIAIKLLNSIACIFGTLKNDDTGALGAAIGAHVDISTNHASDAGWNMLVIVQETVDTTQELTSLTEEILEVLPTNVEGKLR